MSVECFARIDLDRSRLEKECNQYTAATHNDDDDDDDAMMLLRYCIEK